MAYITYLYMYKYICISDGFDEINEFEYDIILYLFLYIEYGNLD